MSITLQIMIGIALIITAIGLASNLIIGAIKGNN